VSVLETRLLGLGAARELRDPLRERVRGDAIADGERADGASRGGAAVDAPTSQLITDESVEPGLVEEAWRRFTPTVIFPRKCQARTWADGNGVQYRSNVAGDSDLCKKHHQEDNWEKHGRVTGPILDSAKLRTFLSAERRGRARLVELL
jgi:hypothetical protein